MENLKFDFNNFFDFNVGKKNGVAVSDLKRLEKAVLKAHLHLKACINDPKSRLKVNLEWTQLPYQDKKNIREIQDLGAGIASKYESVLFLGIGGSYLGLKAAQDALAPAYYNEFSSLRNARPKIYFEGNNLAPQTLGVLLKNLDPDKTAVVVISKSGETIETKASFDVVEAWLKKSVGQNYGRQIFAITDPESGSLRKRVEEEQKRDKESFRNLPLLKGIGGRYSEFNMGLLHFAIIGVDIEKALEGCRVSFERCSVSSIYENPAYMYATLQYILYKKKNKFISIIMPFSEELKSTADWYAQLLAESLGKKYQRKIVKSGDGSEEWLSDIKRVVNCGRTPVICRGTTDLHSIQQNNVEGENNKSVTFIRVENFKEEINVPDSGDFLSNRKLSRLLNLAQEATEWSLTAAERPSCTITMPHLTPFSWGELLFFFQMATAFEGELLNVDAYNQPGVESYKNYMYYKLGKPGVPEAVKNQIKKKALAKKAKFII